MEPRLGGNQALQYHSLQLLEDEITRLENETMPALAPATVLPCSHWQAYEAYTRMLSTKLRLQRLYAERRCLWAEMG